MALLNWPDSEADNDNHEHATDVTDRASVELPNTHYVEINRALADRIAADYDMLIDGADWVPLVEGGRTIGFWLENVRYDSLLDSFGFSTGDVVLWPAGVQLDFTRDEIRFPIRRRGRERTIVVRVTDT